MGSWSICRFVDWLISQHNVLRFFPAVACVTFLLSKAESYSTVWTHLYLSIMPLLSNFHSILISKSSLL